MLKKAIFRINIDDGRHFSKSQAHISGMVKIRPI